MQLYFIRHGQSENNAHWEDKTFQEKSDPELTEAGRTQAGLLGRFLADRQTLADPGAWDPQNRGGFGLTYLYTSLMVRAVATATAISQATDLPLKAWPDIHETGGIFCREDGDVRAGLPGKTRSYFKQHYPHLILPDWLDEKGWWNRPFEPVEDRKPRAARVWAGLLALHGDQPNRPEHRVAIVSHGGFFMYLFTTALGIPMRRLDDDMHEYWFSMNNCAITRLDVSRQISIQYTNRSDFLPDDLIT